MWVFPSSNDPLVVGDRMLAPFGGRGTAHAGRRYRMRPARCQIGLLEFGRDRWAALTAGQDGGEFVTEPAEVTGDRLCLNVDGEFGDVRVAVLDAYGGVLEGYGHEDAVPIERDAIEARVRWASGDSLTALRGRRVRLWVTAARASVYGYRFD